MFTGKTLLITGGTGSFGNAVLSRFLRTDVQEIRIFSRDEKKQEDMRIQLHNDKVTFYIGDVRDPNSVAAAMSGVDYIFHAAALKQVPSCEFFPMEAVRTNVVGTDNVLQAAVEFGVKKVICLSTDKAVYPINAMGTSKAMMEKVMVARARTAGEGSVLCGTRYGNVMASRGSVIPLFIQQIRAGQPMTITDPNMTRYLMSLDDAVDLVLYAYEHASPGDILVQKAPASTIADLARAVAEVLGVPDHPIRIIGTRHGEKLYETLLTREEMSKAEDLGDYYRIPADNRTLNYDKYFVDGDASIDKGWEYTSHNTRRLGVPEVKELLQKLPYVQELLAEVGR